MTVLAGISSRFRYPLQPLLRKRSSELDHAREALAAAVLQLDTREREVREEVARVQQLQDYQRDLSTGGAPIDIEARRRLYECLGSAVAQKEQRAASLDQAKQHHAAIVDRVRVAQQALKALERHREHSERQYDQDQARRSYGTSDELHLAIRRTTGSSY